MSRECQCTCHVKSCTLYDAYNDIGRLHAGCMMRNGESDWSGLYNSVLHKYLLISDTIQKFVQQAQVNALNSCNLGHDVCSLSWVNPSSDFVVAALHSH